MKLFREDPNFYEVLKSIKAKAYKTESRWGGAYLITTYTLKNGEVWEYYDDLDYGVAYSLEKIL